MIDMTGSTEDEAAHAAAGAVATQLSRKPASVLGLPTGRTSLAVYDELVRSALARHRLGMTLLVIFGVVAVALATVGIYAVMSYSVT